MNLTVAAEQPAAMRHRRIRFEAPELAFAGLLLLGFLIVLYETRGLSFFFDDWEFIVNRRGLSPDVLLRPHGPHLSLIPILVYKTVLAVFGASSYLPWRVLAAVDIVALGLALGIACRRLWGRWWGLAPVALLMTLGSGAISLLWSFQVGYAVADVAGLGALVALSSDDPRGDLFACVALVVSLASASQGIGFLAGAAVLIVMRDPRRHGNWRRQCWVVVIPAILYGLWYLKYGHQNGETHLSLWRGALIYVMHALSSTLSGALGLSTPSTDLPPRIDPTFGVPLAVGVIVLMIVALARRWRPPPVFWGALTVVIVLWLAASFSNLGGDRRPTDSRYLPTNVMLLAVCLCAAVPPPRLRRTGTIAVIAGLAIVCVTNAGQFVGVRNEMLSASVASRAELGGLLVVRRLVPATFSPAPPFFPGLINDVTAGPFFSAVDAFGTNADTPAELLRAGAGTATLADQVIERGERIGLLPAPQPARVGPAPPVVIAGAARTRGGCVVLGSTPIVIRAVPGRYELTAPPDQPVSAALGRFAAAYGIAVGQADAAHPKILVVPSDRVPQVPWRLRLTGGGGRLCTVA